MDRAYVCVKVSEYPPWGWKPLINVNCQARVTLPMCLQGRGFESWSHHTKGVKNGTSSSLADARIKGVLLGR